MKVKWKKNISLTIKRRRQLKENEKYKYNMKTEY